MERWLPTEVGLLHRVATKVEELFAFVLLVGAESLASHPLVGVAPGGTFLDLGQRHADGPDAGFMLAGLHRVVLPLADAPFAVRKA